MENQHVYTLENIKLSKLQGSVPREKFVLESCTLFIIVHGTGELWLDDQVYPIPKSGKIIYANPGAVVHYKEEGQGLLLYQLTIGAYGKSEAGGRMLYEPLPGSFFENGELADKGYHQIRELAESMELLSHERDMASTFKLQMLFHEMMYLITTEYEQSRLELTKSSIERAALYMEEHYYEDVNRDQLARMAGLNPEYFSRLFKKGKGRTFSKYLSEIRIRKAQEWLLASKTSLREIAQRIGYRNEFYLSRKFKEVTGVAPSAYLQMPKRIASVSSHFTACLLALGITPVLAKISPFMKSRFQEGLKESSAYTVDLHTFHFNRIVAETSPDLILCYDTYPEIDALKRIAPTISMSLTKLSWREQFSLIAEMVNAPEKAQSLLNELDAKVQQARKRLSGRVNNGATVLILEIWKDKIMLIGDSAGRGGQLLYHMLNLSMPERLRSDLSDGQWYRIVSPEELYLYDADYLFVTIYEEKGGGPYAAQMMGSEAWRSLSAAQRNRVFINDHATFYNWDPISLDVQLELIMEQFMS